jgi:hypothetical protein
MTVKVAAKARDHGAMPQCQRPVCGGEVARDFRPQLADSTPSERDPEWPLRVGIEGRA